MEKGQNELGSISATFGSPTAAVAERDEPQMDTKMPMVDSTETLGAGDIQINAGTLIIFMPIAS